MQKKIIILSISIVFVIGYLNPVVATERPPGIASSPNPVGSGAIALGMGGAYIAMAYDATAASWNPACLVRLDYPEFSFVAYRFDRTEDNTFGGRYSDAGGSDVKKIDFNYLSFACPVYIELLNYQKIVFSLNYQRLYDFTRRWKWEDNRGDVITEEYQQEGDLSALGIACCVDVIPTQLSFGFTLNFWNDDLLGLIHNKWKGTQHTYGVRNSREINVYVTDRYSFSKGFNSNIGLLWNWCGQDKFRIGLVLKWPFTVDLTRETTTEGVELGEGPSDKELDMPVSYGIGFSLEPIEGNDRFTIAADIYRTEWGKYVIRNSEGDIRSPVTGRHPHESDIGATTQIRLGLEWVLDEPEKQHAWTLRGGMFY
ncbi:MAG: hypothetical protein DRH26_07585, partial [Deltaproteobacteria bacterium]